MQFEAREGMNFETYSCLVPREYFDLLKVKFSECIKIYMNFNQNFAGSAMVRPDFPFEQWFCKFPVEENLEES